MIALVKKKYRIRHNVLKELQLNKNRVDALPPSHDDYYEMDICKSIDSVIESLEYKKEEILPEIEVLVYKNQIKFINEDFEKLYSITNIGSVAYYDNFHITMGRKSLLTIIKDSITIVTAVGLFLIAVFSFISNYRQTNTNTKDLDTIKIQLNALQKSITDFEKNEN